MVAVRPGKRVVVDEVRVERAAAEVVVTAAAAAMVMGRAVGQVAVAG